MSERNIVPNLIGEKEYDPRAPIPGLWDIGNPRSIYNLMSPDVSELFVKAKLSHPHWFEVDEEFLRASFRAETGKLPTVIENQVRLSFWCEVDSIMAQGAKEMIDVRRICRGFCNTDTFYRYIKHAMSAAWIACVPLTHEVHLLEMLNFGAYRMREIMRASPVVDGVVNVKLAELQARLYHAAELRAHGAIPQTVRNLNVNLEDPRTVRQLLEGNGTILLEDKVAEMERAAKKLSRKTESQILPKEE